MTNSDDQPLSKQERQRIHDEIRRIAAEATMAHTMSDQESQEAMINIELDNVIEDHQKRIDKLRDQDPVGYGAFGDNPEWIEKQLGDDG
jgi:hypothetical protein